MWVSERVLQHNTWAPMIDTNGCLTGTDRGLTFEYRPDGRRSTDRSTRLSRRDEADRPRACGRDRPGSGERRPRPPLPGTPHRHGGVGPVHRGRCRGGAEAEGPIDHHTVLGYLAALARVFVAEDLPAWAPALRSRSILRSAPTRHFVDPSLAVAALGADPDRLLGDVETLGLLFESLAVRDLRVYAQAFDAQVFHYRDSTDLEADAIVERRDGTWAAFEIKLGPGAVDAAAGTLLRVADRIDQAKHGRPAVLGVITGWGYGYRRADGVAVIPISALAP